jgi:hypothetical protein
MKQFLRATIVLGLLASVLSFIPFPVMRALGVLNNDPVSATCACFEDDKSDKDNHPEKAKFLQIDGGVGATADQQKARAKAFTDSTDGLKLTPDSEGKVKLLLHLPRKQGATGCDDLVITARIDHGKSPKTIAKRSESPQTESDTNKLDVHFESFDAKDIEFPATLTVLTRLSSESEGNAKACGKFKLAKNCNACGSGSSASGNSSCSATAAPAGGAGSVHFSIPIGVSNHGGQSASLEAHIETLPNPGISALKLVASSDINPTANGSGITGAETASMKALVGAPIGGSSDPKAYSVSVSHGSNAPFRTFKVESPSPNNLYLWTTYDGVTTVMTWTVTEDSEGTTWAFTEGGTAASPDGLRKTLKTIKNGAGIRDETVQILERATYSDAFEVVSDVFQRFTTYSWGDALVAEIVERNGANLKSTWRYFLSGPPEGLLKEYERYDGYKETHGYGPNTHYITSRFAGTNLTVNRSIDWSNDGQTVTKIEAVGGSILSHTWTTTGQGISPYTTTKTFSNSEDFSTRTTTYYPSGSQSAGKVASELHEDGTETTYQYNIDGTALQTTAVHAGRQTVTVTNPQGFVTASITTEPNGANSIVLDHWVATPGQIDSHGRPTQIQHFPNGAAPWTTSTTYDCCGVASETDRYGIVTTYINDKLGRARRPTVWASPRQRFTTAAQSQRSGMARWWRSPSVMSPERGRRSGVRRRNPETWNSFPIRVSITRILLVEDGTGCPLEPDSESSPPSSGAANEPRIDTRTAECSPCPGTLSLK